MANDAPTGEQVAHGIIAQSKVEDLQFYLARGRHLERLTAPQLQARWVEVARKWSEAPLQQPTALNDITSEYALRKEKPPYHLVRNYLERAIAAVVARGEQMTDEERGATNTAIIADCRKNSRTPN